jgi:hypothetical protein
MLVELRSKKEKITERLSFFGFDKNNDRKVEEIKYEKADRCFDAWTYDGDLGSRLWGIGQRLYRECFHGGGDFRKRFYGEQHIDGHRGG